MTQLSLNHSHYFEKLHHIHDLQFRSPKVNLTKERTREDPEFLECDLGTQSPAQRNFHQLLHHQGLSKTEEHPLQSAVMHFFYSICFHLISTTLLVKQEFELRLGRIISKRLKSRFSLILKVFSKDILKQSLQMITHTVTPFSLKKN